MHVNIYQYGALLQKIQGKAEQRNKQSGIICNASVLSECVLPKVTIYGSTKAFIKYLCMAINLEFEKAGKKIDLLLLQPHMVVTRMIDQFVARGDAFFTISAERCVATALRDLGYETRTYGSLRHEFIGSALPSIHKYIKIPPAS